MSTLGEQIKQYRKSAGLSQTELAKKIGFGNQSVISAWELGTAVPDSDKLAILCSVLNVSPSVLLGLDDLFLSSPTNELSLSDEELELLRCYRSLDEVQCRNIRLMLEALAQVSSTAHREDEYTFILDDSVEMSDSLFIQSSSAPDYAEMKTLARGLRMLMKKSPYAETDLQHYLARLGYSSTSVADIISIMRGYKVPTRAVYNHIKRFLSGPIKISYPSDE